MTPHKHWLRGYSPLKIPIRLANDQVVYSEGVGSVVFAPEVRGELLREVEFTRVLYVSGLGFNLLSVLYLVCQRRFNVHIYPDRMNFDRDGRTLFCAGIESSNTAYLTGTVIPALESAQISVASTLPLDEALWHCRLAHYHLPAIRDLAQSDMVTGLKLSLKQAADPICKPCLADKLNAAPFPLSQNRAIRPLQLVHSDVHGPLPVCTQSGYCYWV
jgi:hypothetical protein